MANDAALMTLLNFRYNVSSEELVPQFANNLRITLRPCSQI